MMIKNVKGNNKPKNQKSNNISINLPVRYNSQSIVMPCFIARRNRIK